MSMSIDQIFDMMSWSCDEETQQKGIEEARKIKHLSVLIQPFEGKDLWENCAIVIAEKDDKTLERYLIKLFKWIADQNWPGAVIIYERILKMYISSEFLVTFSCVVKDALLSGNDRWLNNLASFLDINEIKTQLKKSTLDILNQYYIGPMSY